MWKQNIDKNIPKTLKMVRKSVNCQNVAIVWMIANVSHAKSQHDHNLRIHEIYDTEIKRPNTDGALHAPARVANNLMIVILGLNSWGIPHEAITCADVIDGSNEYFVCLHGSYGINLTEMRLDLIADWLRI